MEDFIYGVHAVLAMLERAPERAKGLWLLEGAADKRLAPVLALAKSQGLSVQKISKAKLAAKVGDDIVHQGVVLVVLPAAALTENDLYTLLDQAMEDQKRVCVLALDEVQDPRNLGACLRSAAAFAVDVVIAPKKRAASLTAAAKKVACGGADFVPFVTVTNLSRTLKSLQEKGLWVVGTALEAQDHLADVDLRGNVVLVMGSEGAGMRHLTEQNCDFLAKVPMPGVLPSLNVSAATAVCLYERSRQQLLASSATTE